MKLIIAEKPELGRAIAAAISGTEKSETGFIEKGDYYITWCFGHLLTLKEPDDYDEKYATWDLNLLPTFPFNFPNWEYKVAADKQKQVTVIKNLLSKCSSVIHAGDPDEEGQQIVDSVLMFLNNTKPVMRVLINDNNTSAIKKALERLEPNEKYESMGRSAYARAVSDKLFGYNLTRFFSSFSSGTLKVGRVQTPTLGLVVYRDYLIENHIKTEHYSLQALLEYKNNLVSFKYRKDKNTPVNEDNLIVDVSFLEKVKAEIDSQDKFYVNVTKESKETEPPLTFNITELTIYCNKKFGYSSEQVDKTTQNLREKHKLITYNRTDCQYLPEEYHQQAPDTLPIVLNNLGLDLELDFSIRSKVFDDKQITAHHAMIPTAVKINQMALSEVERNIYTAICDFYIVQFLPNKKFITTTAEFKHNENKFSTSEIKVLELGFEKFLKNSEEKKTEKTILSELDEGSYTFSKKNNIISADETKPPKRYTEATLLKDMVSISKFVEDERARALLRKKDHGKKGENGSIGTPATRGSIMTKLLDDGYLEYTGKKKELISTKIGRDLYNTLPDNIKKADTTAIWWDMQDEITKGTKTPDDLINSVFNTVKDIIEDKNVSYDFTDKTHKCPKCESGYLRMIKGKNGNFWGCTEFKNGCKASFDDNKGKPILEKIEYQCPKCGQNLRKINGSKGVFWGCSGFKDGCKASFPDKKNKPDFSEKKVIKSEHKCQCGGDLIKREMKNKKGKFFLGCSNFKDGCKNIYFEQSDGTINKWVPK